MYTPSSQRERLVKLLQQLEAKESGNTSEEKERRRRSFFQEIQLDSQEHQDIQILYNRDFIRHNNSFQTPANTVSSMGIFDYHLTDDGRTFLAEYHATTNVAEVQHSAHGSQPNTLRVFIGHGTDPNGYVPQVVKICREMGAEPVQMIDEPNLGATVTDKLQTAMDSTDYCIIVLTADEDVAGTKRARPNATMEAGIAVMRDRRKLAILVEDGVEIPSNLSGVVHIPLRGQWGVVLIREMKAAGIIS